MWKEADVAGEDQEKDESSWRCVSFGFVYQSARYETYLRKESESAWLLESESQLCNSLILRVPRYSGSSLWSRKGQLGGDDSKSGDQLAPAAALCVICGVGGYIEAVCELHENDQCMMEIESSFKL